MVIGRVANFFDTQFFCFVLKHPLKMPESKASPARKSLGDVKVKYSPVKKSNNIHNNVFVKGYKFGLMSLEVKKFSDFNEDAYFKDFLDVLDSNPKISQDLGIIKVAFVRESLKSSIAKIQSSGYKARQFLGIAPQDHENDSEFRKNWADKIISFMNNEIKWRYSNVFKFRGDLTMTSNGKVTSSLDEVLLDEDIGGFVGLFLFNSIDDIKDNEEVMGDIFSSPENLEVGDSILPANWTKWSNEED
jgi:hypothetical protein